MTLFDPETGKLLDRDGLKSISFEPAGATKPRSVVNADGSKSTEIFNENDGSTAAVSTERADGSNDINAFAKAPKIGGAVVKDK